MVVTIESRVEPTIEINKNRNASFFFLLPLVELQRDVIGLSGAGVLEGKGLPGLDDNFVHDVDGLDIVSEGHQLVRLLRPAELYANLIEVD